MMAADVCFRGTCRISLSDILMNCYARRGHAPIGRKCANELSIQGLLSQDRMHHLSFRFRAFSHVQAKVSFV